MCYEPINIIYIYVDVLWAYDWLLIYLHIKKMVIII